MRELETMSRGKARRKKATRRSRSDDPVVRDWEERLQRARWGGGRCCGGPCPTGMRAVGQGCRWCPPRPTPDPTEPLAPLEGHRRRTRRRGLGRTRLPAARDGCGSDDVDRRPAAPDPGPTSAAAPAPAERLFTKNAANRAKTNTIFFI